MKFKTTFLASILAIGAVSAVSALPWDAKYNPAGSHAHGTAAAVHNTCCNVKTRLTGNQDGKGFLPRQEITCKDNCKAPRIGKNCSSAEARKCEK